MGTNEGDRLKNLQSGISLINQLVGDVIAVSSIYETEPWGVKDQPNFLNLAVNVSTFHQANNLLTVLKNIEKEVGRSQGDKWGPRVLDIDIIFYGKSIINQKDLVIPHSQMQDRNFVLIPLMEIFGDFIHPELDVTMEELYMKSNDTCEVIMTEHKI